MIKVTKILSTLMAIILLSSFTERNPDEFIGTYGVSSSDPSQIKLTINADHTFYYQDLSMPDKTIVAKGDWILKGQKVILQGNIPDEKFHNVWSFDKNGQIAKSRKGLNFYRLCKTDG